MKKKKIGVMVCLVLVVFLVYFIRIGFNVVSIDTESFINSPDDVIYSWYSIGRFSLGIYIRLFNLLPLNFIFNNIVSLLLYFVAVLVLINSFHKNNFNYKKQLLMYLVILTSPLLAEQYAFTLQNVEVALSYLLLVIIMRFILKVIYSKRYIYFIITPLLIFVFGTYQSFYTMYITLAIIYYLDNYDANLDLKKQVGIIFSYLGILVLYGILTVLLGNVINDILKVESTGYLTSQMNWFNGNFIKGILYCGYSVLKVLFGLGVNDNLGFSCLLVFLFFYLKKEGKKKSILYKLALICLMISPFLISLLFGTVTFSRAQFSIPIIMAYLYGKFFSNKKMAIIFAFVVLSQIISTSYLFYIDLERYNNDIKLSNYIKNLDNEDNLPIIFINKVGYERLITGEVLGKSFYNWDYKTEKLSNDRIKGFMMAEEIDYKAPTLEQINEVKNHNDLYNELVNYTDNYIVINLAMYKDY